MKEIRELREHAKEITKQFEDKGYTVEDVHLLLAVLNDEIRQCEEAVKKEQFKALTKPLFNGVKVRKKGKFSIVIRINTLTCMEEFIEKRIIPLKEKYPYADIHIEVTRK